jgi:hypothetical protein
VGGRDLPARLAGLIALNEVIVQGWDIAVATGQPSSSAAPLAQAAYTFIHASVARNPQGSPGMFEPQAPVPDDAPLLDRIIGLTRRDPAWKAGPPRVYYADFGAIRFSLGNMMRASASWRVGDPRVVHDLGRTGAGAIGTC